MIITQLPALPADIEPKLPEPSLTDIGRVLRPLIAQFDADLNYTGAKSGDDLEGLLRGMHEQAIKIGIPYLKGSHSWYSFNVGVYYAHIHRIKLSRLSLNLRQLCYPSHPLDVRVYTGIYTWLAVLVDDGACKDPNQWQDFIIRFQTGLNQITPLATRGLTTCA
ncbi:hypothetical protein E0Z10_g3974 [Xylaria hypoxylon]|uniref:Uncharacterized protein n=1 Tax=Xylaria hypoxylon TaxID=37992 RepID=A0A4Z0Z5W3_9PEZI|nr:hypothetical protein E0Z10_g3974 [Xylaria hypoxylon]